MKDAAIAYEWILLEYIGISFNNEWMKDLDWNLLRSFLAVAETGSLTGAARKLGASQPTLGRHIAELEAEVGVSLFHRTVRGQELTKTGGTFLSEVEKMRDAADTLARRAAGSTDQLSGTVRITASVVIGTLVVPGIIAGLRTAHPELEIEIVATDGVDNLLRRDADIAIRMVKPSQIDLVATQLGDIPIVAGASRSYLDRRGRPEKMTDILDHDILGMDRDDAILRGFAAMSVAVGREFFKFRSDNHLVLWEAMKAGAGIGFAQAPLIAREPEIEVILPELPLPPLPVWLTVHRDIRHAPRIRLVHDHLSEGLRAFMKGW